MSELNVTSKMVEVITGFGLRTAQRILVDLRIELGRKSDEYISLVKFCKVKKIKIKYARERLKKYGLL